MAPESVSQTARRRGSLDPTRTGLLRKSFRAKALLNLRALRADLRHVIVQMDLLGLRTDTNKSVFAFQTPAQRLQQFSGWLETAALSNLDAHWWIYPFIQKAVISGLDRADKEVPDNHFIPNFASFDNLHELAKSEIRGIIAALVQKTNRNAHAAMVQRMSPSVAFTRITQPLDTEFKTRFALFTHFITTKAHAQAKLAVYRHAGVKRVGIDPEHNPVFRTPAWKKASDHLTHDVDENYAVGWGTADDELVCADCDEMAQDSPYFIDEIEDLFPLHPNCRCAPYPWPGGGDFDDAKTVDGEPDGHPFRGNQYAEGQSGGDGDDQTKPAFGASKHSFQVVKAVADTLLSHGDKPKLISVSAKDYRGFKATQDEISPWGMEGKNHDPLFPDYSAHPVVVEDSGGNYHVLDGHNRLSRAIRTGAQSVKVYKFDGWRPAVKELWK